MNLVKKTVITIIISVIVLSESLMHLSAEEMLLFTRAEGLGFDISELVLKETYERAGINIKTVIYPAERSLLISDKGEKA